MILVLQSGTEPRPLAVKAVSLNHGTGPPGNSQSVFVLRLGGRVTIHFLRPIVSPMPGTASVTEPGICRSC